MMKIWIFNDSDSDYYFTTEELAKEYAKYRVEDDNRRYHWGLSEKNIKEIKHQIDCCNSYSFDMLGFDFQIYSEGVNDFKFW